MTKTRLTLLLALLAVALLAPSAHAATTTSTTKLFGFNDNAGLSGLVSATTDAQLAQRFLEKPMTKESLTREIALLNRRSTPPAESKPVRRVSLHVQDQGIELAVTGPAGERSRWRRTFCGAACDALAGAAARRGGRARLAAHVFIAPRRLLERRPTRHLRRRPAHDPAVEQSPAYRPRYRVGESGRAAARGRG